MKKIAAFLALITLGMFVTGCAGPAVSAPVETTATSVSSVTTELTTETTTTTETTMSPKTENLLKCREAAKLRISVITGMFQCEGADKDTVCEQDQDLLTTVLTSELMYLLSYVNELDKQLKAEGY